jgi:hypothetical protein
MRLRGSGSELTTVEFEWKAIDTKIKKVEVSGSWDNWQTRQELFFTEGEGWSGEMDLPPGRYEYKYVIDERIWVANENEETVVCKLGGKNNVLEVLQVVPAEVLQRLTSIQILASAEQGGIAAVDRTMSHDDLSSARLTEEEGNVVEAKRILAEVEKAYEAALLQEEEIKVATANREKEETNASAAAAEKAARLAEAAEEAAKLVEEQAATAARVREEEKHAVAAALSGARESEHEAARVREKEERAAAAAIAALAAEAEGGKRRMQESKKEMNERGKELEGEQARESESDRRRASEDDARRVEANRRRLLEEADLKRYTKKKNQRFASHVSRAANTELLPSFPSFSFCRLLLPPPSFFLIPPLFLVLFFFQQGGGCCCCCRRREYSEATGA